MQEATWKLDPRGAGNTTVGTVPDDNSKAPVSLVDVLDQRPRGLHEAEAWALLCQSVQALQDLFLSDKGNVSKCVPLITTDTLLITAKGYVQLQPSAGLLTSPTKSAVYLAPEYKPCRDFTDAESEKMWIYSLGEALTRTILTGQGAVNRLSPTLCRALSATTRRSATSRASLIYLLNIISDYCTNNMQTKAFSHTLSDLHEEVTASKRAQPYSSQSTASSGLTNISSASSGVWIADDVDTCQFTLKRNRYADHLRPFFQPPAIHIPQFPFDTSASMQMAPPSALNYFNYNQPRTDYSTLPHYRSKTMARALDSTRLPSNYHTKSDYYNGESELERLGFIPEMAIEIDITHDRNNDNKLLVRTMYEDLKQKKGGNNVANNVETNSSRVRSTNKTSSYPGSYFGTDSENSSTKSTGKSSEGNKFVERCYYNIHNVDGNDASGLAADAGKVVDGKLTNVGGGGGVHRGDNKLGIADNKMHLNYNNGYNNAGNNNDTIQTTSGNIHAFATLPRAIPLPDRFKHQLAKHTNRTAQMNTINALKRDANMTTSKVGTGQPTNISAHKHVSNISHMPSIPNISNMPSSNATNLFERPQKPRNAVQRAASRLYKTLDDREIQRIAGRSKVNRSEMKRDDENDHNLFGCIGPEFVVRANIARKQLTVGEQKPTNKIVTVIMLNGRKIDVSCDLNTVTASQISEAVIRSEGIEENFFLGLAALVACDFVFLPGDTKLIKLIGSNDDWASLTLFLRVRLYLPSLRGLRGILARHILYLQLRRSILEQQLPCDLKTMVKLAGVALQVEFGDYNFKEHGTNEYFLMEHYLPEMLLTSASISSQLRDYLIKFHREQFGTSRDRAEQNFIQYAQSLRHYGSHLYAATWVAKEKHSSVWLCITARGISLYERKTHALPASAEPVRTFDWHAIQTLCYSKQYLCVLPHAKINAPNAKTPVKTKPIKCKLKLDQKKSYFAFRLASLHHQFFLKLRNEVTSLQNLANEYGVRLSDDNRKETQFKISFRTSSSASSFDSGEYQPKINCRRSRSSTEISAIDSMQLEEVQNKENEFPRGQRKSGGSFNSDDAVISRNLSQQQQRRQRVLMGTRAIGTGTTTGSVANGNLSTIKAHSMHSLNFDKLSAHSEMTDENCASSSLEAYVLNSTTSSNEKFLPDFQETVSDSLMEKFNKLSFTEERYLRSVVIVKDAAGSLGLQITEGADGNVYVQSIIPNGPANRSGCIFKGDQIIAVNGQTLINMSYDDSLKVLKTTGNRVEFVLSQLSRNHDLANEFLYGAKNMRLSATKRLFTKSPAIFGKITLKKFPSTSAINHKTHAKTSETTTRSKSSENISTKNESKTQTKIFRSIKRNNDNDKQNDGRRDVNNNMRRHAPSIPDYQNQHNHEPEDVEEREINERFQRAFEKNYDNGNDDQRETRRNPKEVKSHGARQNVDQNENKFTSTLFAIGDTIIGQTERFNEKYLQPAKDNIKKRISRSMDRHDKASEDKPTKTEVVRAKVSRQRDQSNEQTPDDDYPNISQAKTYTKEKPYLRAANKTIANIKLQSKMLLNAGSPGSPAKKSGGKKGLSKLRNSFRRSKRDDARKSLRYKIKTSTENYQSFGETIESDASKNHYQQYDEPPPTNKYYQNSKNVTSSDYISNRNRLFGQNRLSRDNEHRTYATTDQTKQRYFDDRYENVNANDWKSDSNKPDSIDSKHSPSDLRSDSTDPDAIHFTIQDYESVLSTNSARLRKYRSSTALNREGGEIMRQTCSTDTLYEESAKNYANYSNVRNRFLDENHNVRGVCLSGKIYERSMVGLGGAGLVNGSGGFGSSCGGSNATYGSSFGDKLTAPSRIGRGKRREQLC